MRNALSVGVLKFMLSRVRTCSLSPSPLKRVCAGVLYACKGEHTLFTSQREREREREREKGRKGEKERV